MTTLFYTHSACVEHDPGFRHPECPDRLRAVQTALDAEEFASLDRRDVPRADPAQIERVHGVGYVETVLKSVPSSGHFHLDPDTVLSPGSGEAALRAAGAVAAAVDAVYGGEGRNAFCAVRPPGHHAEHEKAMGFCLFNNIAIGAHQALAVQGAGKVAVVDFDVHHGNGSQDAAAREKGLFYASSHQSPAYPGTGAEDDRGYNGNVLNVELAPGSGSKSFRDAYERRILPAVRDFGPDLLMISAGFDAHARDPLCQLEVKTDDFAWLTRELMALADDCCEGRLVSVLEGGYDLEALADSAAAHVRELMKH